MTSGASEKQQVIVFGNGRFAELIAYLLQHDSEFDVVGFTVDRPYVQDGTLLGLPVVPFDEVVERFPPTHFKMLVALGYLQINSLRASRYQAAKSMGYDFVSYVSSRASTWPNVDIGENCIIFEHAVLQPFSKVGDNVVVRSSAHISHHVELENHVFVSAGVTIGGGSAIKAYSFIGLNATVRDNIQVAPKCFVAAGAAVMADTDEDGLYVGVPARRHAKPASQLDL